MHIRTADGTSKPVPDIIRVYAAFGIARSDDGSFVPDHDSTTRHETADEAAMAAEAISRAAGCCAGVAFTRTLNLIDGECSRSIIIASFGDVRARERWTEY